MHAEMHDRRDRHDDDCNLMELPPPSALQQASVFQWRRRRDDQRPERCGKLDARRITIIRISAKAPPDDRVERRRLDWPGERRTIRDEPLEQRCRIAAPKRMCTCRELV